MYEDDARAAKGVLDGKKIDGRTIAVKEARPKIQWRLDSSGVQTQGANLQAGNNEQGNLPNRGPRKSHRGWEKQIVQGQKPFSAARGVKADPGEVTRKLRELQLTLVFDSGNQMISILQLINGFRGSRFKASAIDVARIDNYRFLIVFKTKVELTDFVGDSSFWRELGLVEVLPWSLKIYNQ
ncbi:uncharacterized protein LOC131246585 [Magnolia sinica]|uniref:uncharacterized protein LOC131246585 n=1 Tax=Magnolia sinica TaxID=86752 RepID=UPI002658FD68|nr:uncharacterized protein LOC131246585 [Magnolia sinica]